MLTTYKYRLKLNSKSKRTLKQLSNSVNFVWNYCKQTQVEALHRASSKVVTRKNGTTYAMMNLVDRFTLHKLTSGTSEELCIANRTIESICTEYSSRVKQYRKTLVT